MAHVSFREGYQSKDYGSGWTLTLKVFHGFSTGVVSVLSCEGVAWRKLIHKENGGGPLGWRAPSCLTPQGALKKGIYPINTH